MNEQKMTALAQSYRADLLYYIERAKLGKCPPHWQAYCFGEIAGAKGTPAYPADGDALLAELRALVDTVPQQTNREANAAEIAAYHGQMLFYFCLLYTSDAADGIPFDKSTLPAHPADSDKGEFDTMEEALGYLYTCLHYPDSVLC